METSFASHARIAVGGIVLVVALALGCKGKSPSSDAPVGCGGTIDVTGRSPEGPFTATGVYAYVSFKGSTCMQGLQFIVGDSVGGGAFLLDMRVDAVDGAAPVPLGKTSATVNLSGRENTGTALFQATTSATIDVTAADPPPFATCAAAQGDPIGLHTGNIAMSIAMSLDGFAIAGTLSTPYCSCQACPDTI